MKQILAVWLKGRLLVARWSSPKVELTDFYLPDTGYQPGEYVGVVEVSENTPWMEYEFMLDPQSNRDNPVLIGWDRRDPDHDWQNFFADPEQMKRAEAKLWFFPVRGITVEEREKMSLPALPKNVWIEECFRIGINPLEAVKKHFLGWKWECRYRTETPGPATWVGHTGIPTKYFVFLSNVPPLCAELVAERI